MPTIPIIELVDDLIAEPVPVHLPGNAKVPEGWTVWIDPMAYSEAWNLRLQRMQRQESQLIDEWRKDPQHEGEKYEQARVLVSETIADLLHTHPANAEWTPDLVLERMTITTMSGLLGFFERYGSTKQVPIPSKPSQTPPRVRSSRTRGKS